MAATAIVPLLERLGCRIHGINLEPDGRFSLPTEFASVLEVSDGVMLVGKGDKFQLWNPGRWQARRDSDRDKMAAFVRGLRMLDLAKPPGVAETIDWAQALAALGREEIDAEVVEQTLGSVLKYREDIEAVRDETLVGLIEEARATANR